MGEAADNAYNSALDQHETEQTMRLNGCHRCPVCTGLDIEHCEVCEDLGWLNEDGEPCEP